MENYKKIVCRTIFDILFFYRRVTSAIPYLQPRLEIELEGVPAELLTTYHFLAENDERGRHGIVIRLL